jgi:thiol-disulfide isomerase/thioredoxin
MSFRLPILLAVALLTFCGPASAELVDSWEEAKRVAAEENLYIVVDFWADWCGPCKRFDHASDNDPALKAALEGVVLFKTDAERAGKELAKKFLVGGFPTYVVANANGETLGRWWGFESAEEWTGKFAEVMADPITVAGRATRHEESPNATDAFALARFHETREEYGRADELYTEALALDPAHSEKYEDALFENAYSAHRDEKIEFSGVVLQADRILARGDDASAEDLYYLARMMTSAARRAGNVDAAGKYLTVAYDRLATLEDEDSQARLARLAIDHAVIVEKDLDRAVELKKASYEEGWLQDSGAMNGFAWWCFENNVNLIEAEEIARAAVEFADSNSDKANILDTAAEICNARGDCRDAVLLIQQAIELNPEREYFKKQLTRFQKILEATG